MENCSLYRRSENLDRCIVKGYCDSRGCQTLMSESRKPTEAELLDIMRNEPNDSFTIKKLTGGIIN